MTIIAAYIRARTHLEDLKQQQETLRQNRTRQQSRRPILTRTAAETGARHNKCRAEAARGLATADELEAARLAHQQACAALENLAAEETAVQRAERELNEEFDAATNALARALASACATKAAAIESDIQARIRKDESLHRRVLDAFGFHVAATDAGLGAAPLVRVDWRSFVAGLFPEPADDEIAAAHARAAEELQQ